MLRWPGMEGDASRMAWWEEDRRWRIEDRWVKIESHRQTAKRGRFVGSPSRHDEAGALLRDGDPSDRTAVELEKITLDSVRENHATGRHLRFDYQFLAF